MLIPTPIQTTYKQYVNVGQVGMPATSVGWDVDTRFAEDPGGTGIPFGVAVSQGTLHGDKSAALGQLSGFEFIGITAASHVLDLLVHTDKYADGENMPVATRGDWWVSPDGHVSAGDAVYYDATTGHLGNASGSGKVLVNNARWETSNSGLGPPYTGVIAGLAVVRLGASAQ